MSVICPSPVGIWLIDLPNIEGPVAPLLPPHLRFRDQVLKARGVPSYVSPPQLLAILNMYILHRRKNKLHP